MNILITGSNGFIGKALKEDLSDKFNVYGIRRKEFSRNQDSKEIYADLSKKEEAERAIHELQKKGLNKTDIIIHAASKMASSDKNKGIETLEINNLISLNTIQLAKSLSPLIFINISSMSVYPYKDGVFSEESVCAPYENQDFLYGLSKLNSEMLFSFYLQKQKCQLVNLRVAQVYGEGMRKDRIMPVMLKELADKNEIKVFGNGERTTNFIHISDLIKVIKFFLQSPYHGTINVGKENVSLLEIANKLIKMKGNEKSKITLIEEGKKEKFILDTSRLNELIKL